MNNALYTDTGEETDLTPYRERESELVKIIEAVKSLSANPDYQLLKLLIFDGLVSTLEKRLSAEVFKKPLNEPEIYALTGQIVWAKKFSDLDKLADAYRLELTGIRKKYEQND